MSRAVVSFDDCKFERTIADDRYHSESAVVRAHRAGAGHMNSRTCESFTVEEL